MVHLNGTESPVVRRSSADRGRRGPVGREAFASSRQRGVAVAGRWDGATFPAHPAGYCAAIIAWVHALEPP